MGFSNSGACIKFAHTPLKAILLQGTIRSTFPQLWRVACHFKQKLYYFEKQQGESKFALNMPQTPEYSVPAVMY